MAWAWVCASCCQQLAEVVLPTPASRIGDEERTPLLGPISACQTPRPSILNGPGTPHTGFCSPNSLTISDSFPEGLKEAGLSADCSSPQGFGAAGAFWSMAVLLADLEQDERQRQGECALPRAALAGLAPLKPEASWSSSPGPTSCIKAKVAEEAGTRDTDSASPGLESWLPHCHGSPKTSEPTRAQPLSAPGGLWGYVNLLACREITWP
jgi:hypothetical protein